MATPKSWLDELQAQLKDVKIDCEPDDPMGEGEKEVGILPVEDRPLYALGGQLIHKANALAGSEHHRSRDGCSTCIEMQQCQATANTLGEMFWTACRARFKIWDGSVGIRKGWKVVKIEDAQEGRRPSLISILLGR